MLSRFLLYYDHVLVAHIPEAEYSDYTWQGTFKLTLSSEGQLEQRLGAFIALCRDWHRRLRHDPMKPPSATEFDPFNDIIYSGLWHLKSCDDDSILQVDSAPVFQDEAEISWKCP